MTNKTIINVLTNKKVADAKSRLIPVALSVR
jgi:hypothetical protein